MNGIHILFISSWYPNRNNSSHGIFNRAFAQAAATRSRVSVLHVSSDDKVRKGFEIEVIEDSGLFTVYVYYPAIHGKYTLFHKILQHFRRKKAYRAGFAVIKQKAGLPTIIQLNVMLPAGPGALALSRKYRIPLVINECWTGFDPLDGRYKGFMWKLLTRRIFSAARAVMPVSGYLRGLMESHGLRGNYHVVPNVVDTNVFASVAVPPSGNLRFIHVSALDDQQKNVSGIISAFVAARKQLPDAELAIVGDGPDAARLRERVTTLNLGSSIKFRGLLSPVQLARELNASDVLVMFSNYETFCVAVPEALACGKPVITSDAGGIMSYMRPDLGVIVPKNDEAALTEAMTGFTASRHKFDPIKLREFVIARFSPDVVSDELHKVYTSVLHKA